MTKMLRPAVRGPEVYAERKAETARRFSEAVPDYISKGDMENASYYAWSCYRCYQDAHGHAPKSAHTEAAKQAARDAYAAFNEALMQNGDRPFTPSGLL